TAGLAAPERPRDLVDRSAAGGQQPLHMVFRRGLQPALAGHFDGVDVLIADRMGGQQWRTHLQHAARIEKGAYRPQQVGTRLQGIKGRGGPPGCIGHEWAQLLMRPTYSPVRVSTLMISPSCTNNGTRTTAPVLSVAGLPP